jgi:hypothetical protein
VEAHSFQARSLISRSSSSFVRCCSLRIASSSWIASAVALGMPTRRRRWPRSMRHVVDNDAHPGRPRSVAAKHDVQLADE